MAVGQNPVLVNIKIAGWLMARGSNVSAAGISGETLKVFHACIDMEAGRGIAPFLGHATPSDIPPWTYLAMSWSRGERMQSGRR